MEYVEGIKDVDKELIAFADEAPIFHNKKPTHATLFAVASVTSKRTSSMVASRTAPRESAVRLIPPICRSRSR